MASKTYHITFNTNNIIPDCKICLKCKNCNKGEFNIYDILSYLFKIYKEIETGNMIPINIIIYYKPYFIIPCLPNSNVDSVSGLTHKIEYPITIKCVEYFIHCSSDQEVLQCAPINLQELKLYIILGENITNFVISNISPYLKCLKLDIWYNEYKCCVDINEIPDSVEYLYFESDSDYFDELPFIFIGNLWRLPSKLKQIVLNRPLAKMHIFSDTSSINLISKGVEYKGIGMHQCLEALNQYCDDNDIKLVLNHNYRNLYSCVECGC